MKRLAHLRQNLEKKRIERLTKLHDIIRQFADEENTFISDVCHSTSASVKSNTGIVDTSPPPPTGADQPDDAPTNIKFVDDDNI